MVVQAAIVEVDRADDGLAVVADKDLGMHKTRLILVDLHAP